MTVQGKVKPLNFPSLGLVRYQFEWDIDVNLQDLRPAFLLEVLQSGNFSDKCRIFHQIKDSANYVVFFLWPYTVREFRIVTTTDRDRKCRSDPRLCSPLLSNVGNVTEIPSTDQGIFYSNKVLCILCIQLTLSIKTTQGMEELYFL